MEWMTRLLEQIEDHLNPRSSWTPPIEEIRIEPSRGATYSNPDERCVYAYGEYETSSVLHGRRRRVNLGTVPAEFTTDQVCAAIMRSQPGLDVGGHGMSSYEVDLMLDIPDEPDSEIPCGIQDAWEG